MVCVCVCVREWWRLRGRSPQRSGVRWIHQRAPPLHGTYWRWRDSLSPLPPPFSYLFVCVRAVMWGNAMPRHRDDAADARCVHVRGWPL